MAIFYLEVGIGLHVVLIQVGLDLWGVAVDAVLGVAALLLLWLDVSLALLIRLVDDLAQGEQLLAAHLAEPLPPAALTGTLDRSREVREGGDVTLVQGDDCHCTGQSVTLQNCWERGGGWGQEAREREMMLCPPWATWGRNCHLVTCFGMLQPEWAN